MVWWSHWSVKFTVNMKCWLLSSHCPYLSRYIFRLRLTVFWKHSFYFIILLMWINEKETHWLNQTKIKATQKVLIIDHQRVLIQSDHLTKARPVNVHKMASSSMICDSFSWSRKSFVRLIALLRFGIFSNIKKDRFYVHL